MPKADAATKIEKFKGKLCCKRCKKYVRPNKNIVAELRGEKFLMLAMLCPKCKSVAHQRYDNQGRIEFPRDIKRAVLPLTLEQYTAKYAHMAQRSHHEGCGEFFTEPEAEEYLGLRQGYLKALRRQKTSPQHHYDNGLIYWKEDLDEWMLNNKARLG